MANTVETRWHCPSATVPPPMYDELENDGEERENRKIPDLSVFFIVKVLCHVWGIFGCPGRRQLLLQRQLICQVNRPPPGHPTRFLLPSAFNCMGQAQPTHLSTIRDPPLFPFLFPFFLCFLGWIESSRVVAVNGSSGSVSHMT